MKTIHINNDIHSRFKLQAIIENKTVIKLVEELIEEYLEKTKSKSEEYLKKMERDILKEYNNKN